MAVDSNAWDERYGASELVWSADPNVFVAEVLGPMPAGRALDMACGEGRNAIWLALQGWTVTGVDFSPVAIDKARRLAAAAGATVRWACEDVVRWEPRSGSFDVVLLSYLQLPAGELATTLGHAARALAPGGSLLVVGHARANLAGGYGGPKDPAVLYEPEDVAAQLAGLRVRRSEHVTRTVETDAGPRHAIDTLVLASRDR